MERHPITKNGSPVTPIALDTLPAGTRQRLTTEMEEAAARGYPVGYIAAMPEVPGGYVLYAAQSPQWHTKVAEVYPSGHVDRYPR